MDDKVQYAIEALANLLYLIELQADAPIEVRHYAELTKVPMQTLVEAARAANGSPAPEANSQVDVAEFAPVWLGILQDFPLEEPSPADADSGWELHPTDGSAGGRPQAA